MSKSVLFLVIVSVYQSLSFQQVLESVVKNCGSPIHNEIGTVTYMEQLRELHKTSPHEIVKNKILELLQAWGFAFRNNPKYRAVQVRYEYVLVL